MVHMATLSSSVYTLTGQLGITYQWVLGPLVYLAYIPLVVLAGGVALLIVNLLVAWWLYYLRINPAANGWSNFTNYPRIPPLAFTYKEPTWATDDEASLEFTDTSIVANLPCGPPTNIPQEDQNLTGENGYPATNHHAPLDPDTLSEPEELDRVLNLVIDHVLRDFLKSWFHTISTDGRFPHSVRSQLTSVLRGMVPRAQRVDLPLLLSNRLIPMVTAHLHQFRLAERRAQREWLARRQLSKNSERVGQQRGSTSAWSENWKVTRQEKADWDRLVYEQYDRCMLHPALLLRQRSDHEPKSDPTSTSLSSSSSSPEAASDSAAPAWVAGNVSIPYLQHLCTRILPILCPPNMLESRLQKVLIRELVVGTLLRPICCTLIDPDTWNHQLNQYLTKAIEEQNMVNLLRRALHEQSQPVDLPPAAWNATADGLVGWADSTGLATVAAKLQDAASQAAHTLSLSTGLVDSDTPTFDEFVHRIKKCQNLEEAQTIRNQIVTQIRTKRILVEGRTKNDIVHGQRVKDVNVYINRLFVAKKLAEKQIMLLGSKVYPEEQSDSYPGANEVTNHVEISRRSGTRRNSQPSGTRRGMVPPIITRDYHREKDQTVDSLTSTPAPFGFQEILTNPSALSYFTEYMDLIGKVNNLQFWLTIEGLKRHPLVTTENRLDTVIWSIYRTYFSHEVVDDLEIAPEVYKDLMIHFDPFLARQRLTGPETSLSTVPEEQPVPAKGSKEGSQLPRSNSVDSSLSQSSGTHQNQRLFELIIVAQHDVFESMKRLHYPQFLRSGLYQRFLTSYTLAQSKPSYAASIASSRASSRVRRSSMVEPTSQPSPLSSVGQSIPKGGPFSPGSVDSTTHLSRRQSSQLSHLGLSPRLANLSPRRRTSMQKMSPLFPQDRSTPSTSLVTATVTVQSSRNSVDESDDGGSDRSSVMSLVVPEGSVVNPVSTEHGRLRSNSRLSQWSQRSGSAVPKGNNLGPLQSSSSLPLPTLSHTRSVTGATTTATAGTVPTETEQTRLGMGNTLKPGPPVQRRLSEDVGDPNDIPDTDLLATGAVEAVEAALSSIVRNTPARATGCGVRFEEPRGDRADSTTTYWGPGDTLTDSSAKEQTNPESCESDSASSARSKPQEHAESSTSWWSYPTLMWQNNDSSTNSIEDNNPDEAPASDDKSSTLLTTFLRSPMQYFGGKGDTRGITDSESIPEDGSTKPGTEVSFSGPTRDGGALAATLTTPALASTDGESDREDSVIDETLLQNSVYQAPPGDLLLSNKIAKIAQELDRKRQQHAIVLALIDKAKTLDKWNELRILQKSQSALNREIQLLSFQRQQYERQAKENVIVPKVTRITIPSCNRSFTHDMTTEVAAVELGERRGTATKRSTQQVTPMEEWSHVRSSVEGAEVPEGIRSRNTIAGSSSMVRRNPHYSRLNPNPLRSSLFLDSVDLTANVSDYPVDSVNVTSPPSRITTNRKVNDAALPTHANSSSGLSLTTPSTVTTMSAETAPGTVQTPTTAFTLYLIEIQQMSADGSYDSGWVVARRYREFSALHQQLKRRFSVVRQYDFPRKHQLPTLSKLWPLNPARREFPWPPHVENRRLALEKYLQSITQHQEVCQSLELRWFLSQQQRELSALSEILGRESASDETVKSGLGLLGIVAPTEAVGTGTKGELPSGESASSSASLNEMDGNTSTLSISTMRTVGMSKDANRPSRRGVGGHHRVATASSTSTAAGHPGTLSNTQLTRKGLRGEQRHQRSSSFLNPVQKTIADGLEDIVGSPVVLDMISEQLSRQVTGLTPTSHLVYRQKGEEPRGKHHRYPTTTTGMVTSVATNVTSMADPLCDLMIEVFELKSKNNWLRRQAISMLLRTLLGNTIDWWFRETVQDLVAIPQLTQYLRTLHDNLWPGNRPFTPPTPRTDVEKFTTWEEAGAKWRFYMPTVAGSLVGRRNARRGANRIFHLMQNPHLNENLLYFILDELVLTLFPELLP